MPQLDLAIEADGPMTGLTRGSMFQPDQKPVRTDNKRCRRYVTRLVPFKASNLFAEYIGHLYVVYSYGHHWPMLVWDDNREAWFINTDTRRRSRSTNRQMSQATPWDNPMNDMRHDEMLTLVNKVYAQVSGATT